VKKLIGLTALISGILLLLVPRYMLPACEYEGFPAMHCSDTAHAEFVTGALLMMIGIMTLFLKSIKMVIAGAVSALALFVVSFMFPDKFGYCHSSRMPCNYGMVPGIRLIAIISGIIMIAAIIGIVRRYQKKGTA
jgi:hypothetical protein